MFDYVNLIVIQLNFQIYSFTSVLYQSDSLANIPMFLYASLKQDSLQTVGDHYDYSQVFFFRLKKYHVNLRAAPNLKQEKYNVMKFQSHLSVCLFEQRFILNQKYVNNRTEEKN